jgi:O-antigen ligase
LLSYGSLLGVALLTVGLVGLGDVVVRILHAEPLMTLYFFVVALSPIWADRRIESVEATVNLLAMIGLAVILLARFRPHEVMGFLVVACGVGTVLNLFWVLFMGPLGGNGLAWDGLATQKNGLGYQGLLSVMIFVLGARIFPRFRQPLYLLTGVALVLLVGSESKTSLGAALVTASSSVVFVVFRARKTLRGAVNIAVGIGVVFSILLVTANLEWILGRMGKDITFTGRVPLWGETLRGVWDRPWLGHGYDGFWGGPLSAAHRIAAHADFGWGPTHAHNALIESALHVGIPMTLVYLVFHLRALWRATDHVRWVHGPIGLFPLVFLTMVTMTSITESGIFAARLGLTLYVVAIVWAKVGVDEAHRSGAIRLDHLAAIRRGTEGDGQPIPVGPIGRS